MKDCDIPTSPSDLIVRAKGNLPHVLPGYPSMNLKVHEDKGYAETGQQMGGVESVTNDRTAQNSGHLVKE